MDCEVAVVDDFGFACRHIARRIFVDFSYRVLPIAAVSGRTVASRTDQLIWTPVAQDFMRRVDWDHELPRRREPVPAPEVAFISNLRHHGLRGVESLTP